MAWRDAIRVQAERLRPVVLIVLVLCLVGGILEFVPARGAGALLGVLLGAALFYYIIRDARLAAQLAVFWSTATVTADAAYARLNDQTPVTLANVVVKVVDAIAKLADPLIKGMGLGAPDPRARVLAVAPEFTWALILSLLVFMILNFNFALGRK